MLLEAKTYLHGHGGKEPEEDILEDGDTLFFLLPYLALQIAQDHDKRLGAVWGQVLVPLDGHCAHGGKGLRDAFGKATEAMIFLEGDFHLGVIFDEPVHLPNGG